MYFSTMRRPAFWSLPTVVALSLSAPVFAEEEVGAPSGAPSAAAIEGEGEVADAPPAKPVSNQAGTRKHSRSKSRRRASKGPFRGHVVLDRDLRINPPPPPTGHIELFNIAEKETLV